MFGSLGLEMIATFAATYPKEILILDFGHFAAMGDDEHRTLPIPDSRMDELADIMLNYLGKGKLIFLYYSLDDTNLIVNHLSCAPFQFRTAD